EICIPLSSPVWPALGRCRRQCKERVTAAGRSYRRRRASFDTHRSIAGLDSKALRPDLSVGLPLYDTPRSPSSTIIGGWGEPLRAHSCLIASMGSLRAALTAGATPNTIPTPTQTLTPSATACQVISGVRGVYLLATA